MKCVFSHMFRLMILLVLVAASTFILLSFSPIDPIRAYIGNDLLHVPPPNNMRALLHAGDSTSHFGNVFVVGFYNSYKAILAIQCSLMPLSPVLFTSGSQHHLLFLLGPGSYRECWVLLSAF